MSSGQYLDLGLIDELELEIVFPFFFFFILVDGDKFRTWKFILK